MKPAYEHVSFGDGCSVRVYHRRLPRIPFEWHHHPEYELTLTLNSHGKRYIGDSITSYGADDLVLVPPDLPHTWSSNRSIDADAPQVAIVVWFSGDWARRLADCCAEYAALHRLLRRASCGLAFGPDMGRVLYDKREALLSASPRERLAAVLDALCALADASAEPLASPSAFASPTPNKSGNKDGNQYGAGTRGRPSGHEPERINRVLTLIDTRFADPLRIADFCEAASLSERSLHRYFIQHVGESVSRYVLRVRIGHACRMLTDTSSPVSVIAARSGFTNVAHFNRQFKTLKNTTPAAFRKQFSTSGVSATDDATPLTARSPSLERKHRVTTTA